MGLSREETLTVPFSALLDLIAIDQIKRGELEAKPTEEEETEEFLRLMRFR